MTREEAIHKLDFMKKAYQKLIDEKVDSGKLVGDGVSGEWKAETPLDEAYKSMIDALEMAIKALEQEPFINKPCVSEKVCEHDKQMVLDKIRAEIMSKDGLEEAIEIIDKYKAESEG